MYSDRRVLTNRPPGPVLKMTFSFQLILYARLAYHFKDDNRYNWNFARIICKDFSFFSNVTNSKYLKFLSLSHSQQLHVSHLSNQFPTSQLSFSTSWTPIPTSLTPIPSHEHGNLWFIIWERTIERWDTGS